MNPLKTQPDWYALSHHNRYVRLNEVRYTWFQDSTREIKDQSGRTVYLDGAWINDIPGFYLSLGEAIHGPNGYFAGSLDALSDCLCGGFGILPPLTIRLSHFDEVREVLDGRAWCRFRAEGFQEDVAEGADTEDLVDWGYLGDGSPTDIARWTAIYEAALAGTPFDCDEFGSYFDAILEALAARGAELVPDEGVTQ